VAISADDRDYHPRRQYGRKDDDWHGFMAFVNAASCPESEFRAHYRLPMSVFNAVVERIRMRIQRSKKRCVGIRPEVRVAMALRFLAGAVLLLLLVLNADQSHVSQGGHGRKQP
jgi:hypothetical protein